MMKRVVTAAIAAPVFIYITLFAPYNVFVAAMELMAAICFLEFCSMAAHRGTLLFRVRGLLAAMLFPIAFISSHYVGYMVMALVLMAVLSMMFEDQAAGVDRAALTLFGVAYVGLAFTAPVLIRPQQDGPQMFLLICVATWGADIGAYYVGRRFGKRKLAPSISPGKTVEGFAGGCLSAVAASAVYALFFFKGAGIIMVLGAGVIGGVAGPFGDLSESLFKRHFGVKDSGSILPGHGGLLDRADALMATGPLFYVFLTIAGRIS